MNNNYFGMERYENIYNKLYESRIITNNNWDFKGWATYYNELCEDNRILESGCFDHQNGQIVPLCLNNNHYDSDCILGKCLLEVRKEGIYCYGYFFDLQTPHLKQIKERLLDGTITDLSIFANKLKEQKSFDKHIHTKYGIIREVSLTLCGSNPKAKIEVIQL